MPALSRFLRGTLGVAVAASVVACGSSPDWLHRGRLNQVLAASGPGQWPEASAGAYLAGRFALEQGDTSTAAREYAVALQADPGNSELRRQLFAIQLADGRFDVAKARELAADPAGSEEAVLLLALQAIRDRNWPAASRELGRVPPRGLGDLLAPLMQAWLGAAQGQTPAALSVLDGVQRDDGFRDLREYHAGMIAGLGGDLEGARRRLGALVDGEGPAPVRFVAGAAWATAKAGDIAAARELVLRQSARQGANPLLERVNAALAGGRVPNPPVDGPATAMGDALLALAAALQDQGHDAQSVVFARLATFADPNAGDAWIILARGFTAQGNPGQAERVLAEVPPHSPYYRLAQLSAAETLATRGSHDEAATKLRALAAAEPSRPDAMVALGDLLRGDDRFEEARAAYTEALARIPDRSRTDWRLLYARGIANERSKHWPEAEADFLAALELAPDQPMLLNYLGYSWVEQGLNLERAKAMLERAVALRPQDGFIVDSLGWALFRTGDGEGAVVQLERAAELEPGDPTINDHLGDAYERVGRTREARFQWQRALILKPDTELKAALDRKLGRGPNEPAPL